MRNQQHRILAGLVFSLMLLISAAVQAIEPLQPGWPLPVDDRTTYSKLLFDRLEYASDEESDRVVWDGQFWYGNDYQRLWIETEGEDVVKDGNGGEIENFDVQYSRLIAPFWDFQTGLGYQRLYGSGPDRDRFYALVGLQGLVPYQFEVDLNLRVSEDGDVWTDLEATYDFRLTQRLILQPRLDTAVAFSEAEDFESGTGLNFLSLGLRLRYQIRREFAPYLGVNWSRKVGNTADLARDNGNSTGLTAIVAGVRMWF